MVDMAFKKDSFIFQTIYSSLNTLCDTMYIVKIGE